MWQWNCWLAIHCTRGSFTNQTPGFSVRNCKATNPPLGTVTVSRRNGFVGTVKSMAIGMDPSCLPTPRWRTWKTCPCRWTGAISISPDSGFERTRVLFHVYIIDDKLDSLVRLQYEGICGISIDQNLFYVLWGCRKNSEQRRNKWFFVADGIHQKVHTIIFAHPHHDIEMVCFVGFQDTLRFLVINGRKRYIPRE